MILFLLSLAVVTLAVAGLAAGVLLGRRALAGSCGGAGGCARCTRGRCEHTPPAPDGQDDGVAGR